MPAGQGGRARGCPARKRRPPSVRARSGWARPTPADMRSNPPRPVSSAHARSALALVSLCEAANGGGRGPRAGRPVLIPACSPPRIRPPPLPCVGRQVSGVRRVLDCMLRGECPGGNPCVCAVRLEKAWWALPCMQEQRRAPCTHHPVQRVVCQPRHTTLTDTPQPEPSLPAPTPAALNTHAAQATRLT